MSVLCVFAYFGAYFLAQIRCIQSTDVRIQDDEIQSENDLCTFEKYDANYFEFKLNYLRAFYRNFIKLACFYQSCHMFRV